MTWRDNMQPGSFRGVPFLATSSDLAFGRNVQVQEFPLGETPGAEDLGLKADVFTIEVFVIGDNYMSQRDALLTAFKAPGQGTLIHPWQGTRQVQMREGRVRETKDSGGMAVFTVTMVAASPQPLTGSIDTQAVSSGTADDTDTQGQTSLTDRLSVTDEPTFVQQGAASVVQAISGAIGALVTAASCVGDGLFALQTGASLLGAQALAMLATPAALATQVQSLLGQIDDLATFPEDALSGFQGLMTFGGELPQPATTTTSGQIEADNQAALVQVFQAAAAAAAVRLAAELDYSSYDAASALRDQLSDAIDDIATSAADAGDYDLWVQLGDLRFAMVNDLTARGASLDQLYAYTPPVTEPALVIAYRLYADATRADEIVNRNAIINPLFVPGGQPIQVLSNE